MCLLSCSLNTTLCAPHSLKEEEEARGQKPRPHRRVLVVVSSKVELKRVCFFSLPKRDFTKEQRRKETESAHRRGRYEAD